MQPNDVAGHAREVSEQQRQSEAALRAATDKRVADAGDVSGAGIEANAAVPASDSTAARIDRAGDLKQVERINFEKQNQAYEYRITARIERAEDLRSYRGDLPRVSGFEKSGAMTNEEVKRFVADQIPPEHARSATLPTLKYEDRYVGDAQKTTLGYTEENKLTGENPITILRQDPNGSFDKAQMEQTIAHEIGHNVHLTMPEAKWNAWQQVEAGDQIAGRDSVSSYARTSSYEDFAESYAAYILEPDHLQDVSPAKYEFMRDQVFAGRTYHV